MDSLESLHDEVYVNGIEVVDGHFSKTKKGTCLYSGTFRAIVLDRPRIRTSAEERTILAEEYAHYETGSLYSIDATYNTRLGRINRSKYEAAAKRYAIKKLLPFDELKAAIMSGWYCSNYEIAETFNVTEELVEQAIEYYTVSLGLSLRDDDGE